MAKYSWEDILLDMVCCSFPEGILFILGAIVIFTMGPYLLFHFAFNFSDILSIILNVIYLILLVALIVFIAVRKRAANKRKIREKIEEQRWLERGGYVEGPENPKDEELDPEVEAFMKYRDEYAREHHMEGAREGLPHMAPPVPETPDEYYRKRWGGVYSSTDNKG